MSTGPVNIRRDSRRFLDFASVVVTIHRPFFEGIDYVPHLTPSNVDAVHPGESFK